MAAESLYLRTTTFTAGTSWLKTYADALQANDLRLGRTRYTAGEVALAQADAEIGALHVNSAKVLRLYRQSGTSTSNDSTRAALSTPIRGTWHYDDNTGDPSSAASVEGDLYVRDAGGSNAWLEAYDGSTYRGLGVMAENRTTATNELPLQSSDRVTLRSQVYSGGAARHRDVFMVSEPVTESGQTHVRLAIRFREEEAGADVDLAYLRWNRAFGPGDCLDASTLELIELNAQTGGALDDAFVAGLRSRAGYDNGTTVARHNLLDFRNPATSGGASVAHACLVRFDAAAGTHKGLDSATGGAKWAKVNENGTVRFFPILDSKELPFPSGSACADLSIVDGATVQTMASSGTWYTLGNWLTEGLAVGATPDSATGTITIDTSGDWLVTFTASASLEAGESYRFRFLNTTGPSSSETLNAQAYAKSTDGDVVSIAMHAMATLADGDVLEVQVFSVLNPGVDITVAGATFSAVRIR